MKLAVVMLVFARGKLNVLYCFAFFRPFTTAFQTTHHPDYHFFSWSFVAPHSRFLRHSLAPSPSRKQHLVEWGSSHNTIFYVTCGVCRDIFASIKSGGGRPSVNELINVREYRTRPHAPTLVHEHSRKGLARAELEATADSSVSASLERDFKDNRLA